MIVAALAYLVRRWQQENVLVGRANRFFDCLTGLSLGKRNEMIEDGVVEAASSAAGGVGDAADAADDTHDAAGEKEEEKSHSITEYIVKTKIVLGLYQIIGSMKWSLPSVVFPKLLQAPLSIGNLVQCGVRLKSAERAHEKKKRPPKIRSFPDESYPLPEFDSLSLNTHR